MASKPLKIFMHAIDGTGHVNAAIGLGQAAVKRGHKVSYLLNEAFKGQVSPFGIEEILLVDKSKPKQNKTSKSSENENAPNEDNTPIENPIKKFAKGLMDSGMLSGADSLAKLKLFSNVQYMEDLLQTVISFEAQIDQAIADRKPDLIILDHIMVSPAIQRSKIPFVMIFSGNPLYVFNSNKLPPPSSGYATDSDPATWAEFDKEYLRLYPPMFRGYQKRLNEAANFEPTTSLTPGERSTFPESPYLNLYGFPLELDYQDVVPLSPTYCQIDAFCRVAPEQFTLPQELNVQPGDKLIFVSMGSMGSIDVELNLKFARILAKTPHKIIFSKGPLADEFELPGANFWGQASVPQTALLPLVDLVITHGGNNTVTEAFSFGKPMIVHPLFGDQWDNAQRVEEKGYGVRLKPYDFTEEELLNVVDRLLNDAQLHERLKVAAKRIEASRSKDKALEKMERLVEELSKSSSLF